MNKGANPGRFDVAAETLIRGVYSGNASIMLKSAELRIA